MKIHSLQPLSLAEAHELAGTVEEKRPVDEYFKKFSKLNVKQAHALKDELRGMNNVKLKEETIAKICDFLPKDAEDVHKIFSDVSLEEKEINDILQIVARY